MTTPKDKAWAALAADIPTFSQAQADAIVARHRPIIEAAISAEPLDVARLRADWTVVRSGLPTRAVGPRTTAMLAAAARLDAALGEPKP